MGPRPFSRGNGGARMRCRIEGVRLQWGHGLSAVEMIFPTSSANQEILLQWGHGLSAVEISFNPPTTRPTKVLQWGHGLSAVEMMLLPWLVASNRAASMGPRPFSRGNEVRHVGPHVYFIASMGPRPFSRGNQPGHGRLPGRCVASMGPRPFSRGNSSVCDPGR